MKDNIVNQLQKELATIDLQHSIKQILEHEKEYRGIDWLDFYSGKGNQDAKVIEVLSSLNLSVDINLLRTNPMAYLEILKGDENINANLHIGNLKDEGMMIDYIQGLRGNEMKKYVVYLTSKLQLAESQTSVTLIAVELASTGILAIGGLWLKGTIQALIAGESLLSACAAGISSLGITAAITIIAVLVVIILIPFFIIMDKKSEMLALILNRTPRNINISYYFSHGKLVSKPCELIPSSLTTPERWVSITAVKKIKDDEICSAGILFVSKLDKALIGVEGACKLDFEGECSTFPHGVHIGFSVPLLFGDNKCFISWEQFSNIENFYDNKYDDFALQNAFSDNQRLIQACMDSPDGGEPVMVAVIQAK